MGFRPRECRRCGYALAGLGAAGESVTCPECGEVHHDRACLRCGYSLAGLPDAGGCPECGERFAEQSLILAGMPKAVTSGGRRAAWAALIVTAVVIIQFWFLIPGWVLLVMGLCVLFGLPAMLVTSTRERTGVERFIVSPGGICRIPFKVPKARKAPQTGAVDALFIPWGTSNAVRIKRVGPFWKRVQVGRISPSGVFKDVVFEAGVRCPDASAELVRATVQGLIDAHHWRRAQEEGPLGGPSPGSSAAV